MKITAKEVTDFLNNFLNDCDSSAEIQASYFLHPNEARFFLPNGATIDMKQHVALLKPYKNIKRTLGSFTLTEINDEPARARVEGSFYFEWPHPESTETVRGVAVFSYIVEKQNDKLKFVLYLLTAMPTLPNSGKMNV